MKLSITFGAKVIDFQLEFCVRKTLGIYVTPEQTVLVKAPVNSQQDKILQLVKKRAAWIIRQQNFFATFQPKPPAKKYVSGETHLYLGRQYRLKVFATNVEQVKFSAGIIEVYSKGNPEQTLKHWYQQQAKQKFIDIAEPLIQRFSKYHVAPTSICVREMPKRWGSCTARGKIILNRELIKAPRICIEYVIIHELCHLIERNHNQRFYALQNREMPNWQKHKARLERLMICGE